MNFKEWFYKQVISESRPGTKHSLYPSAYVGIYAPCDWMPYAADFITYAPKEWLKFKFLNKFQPPPLANRESDVKYVSIPYDLPPAIDEGYRYWDDTTGTHVDANIIILWKDVYDKKPKMKGKVGGPMWDQFAVNANAGHGTAYFIEAASKDEALARIAQAEPHPTLHNVFVWGQAAKKALER